MSSISLNASVFLIDTITDIFIFILITRLILFYISANYKNPFTQFIIKMTHFIIGPMRKIIPDFRNIELATILVIFILELIKYFLISTLSFGYPTVLGVFLLAFVDSIKLILEVFFYAIILQAIVAWLDPYGPVSQILSKLTYPILKPFKRITPMIANIDLSPIPALLCLQLIIIVMINPLMAMSLGVAIG